MLNIDIILYNSHFLYIFKEESEMKSLKKSIVGILVCITAIAAVAISASAYAYDNNYGYSFTVKPKSGLSYSSDIRYRGATTTKTPWKVNFTYSSEGKKTVMTYFLASSGWFPTKFSDFKNVTQGSGDKYFRAYDVACETDVQLAAKNNNNTANSYTISGYWDEETAKHAFSY